MAKDFVTMLVSNISRFDENNREDAQCIYNIMVQRQPTNASFAHLYFFFLAVERGGEPAGVQAGGGRAAVRTRQPWATALLLRAHKARRHGRHQAVRKRDHWSVASASVPHRKGIGGLPPLKYFSLGAENCLPSVFYFVHPHYMDGMAGGEEDWQQRSRTGDHAQVPK